MPPSDPEIQAAAEAVFQNLLSDLILDTAISAHRDIKRGRVPCGTCGTLCRSHNPLQPSIAVPPASSQASTSASRATTPLASPAGEVPRTAGYAVGPEKGTGGATGIGSGSGRMDGSGNVFFDCLVCYRPIACNRYAPHLSSCLGLNGSTRRGAARSAAAKVRAGANDRSSPSPYYVPSEGGDSDDGSVSGKKGRKNLFNGASKRGRSPGKGALVKKTKLSSGTSTPNSTFARNALPPSRLGPGRPATSSRPPPSASTTSSPTKSVISVENSQGTGGAGTIIGEVDGDIEMIGNEPVVLEDSSDDALDDY